MKNIIKRQSGFTLIELLVVIAIIGILASVVVGSLNYARTKGVNAGITADMNGSRSQAELYFSDNSESFAGVCDVTPTADGTATINASLVGAQTKWGTSTQAINIDLGTAGSWDTVTCHEDGASFAAEAPLSASAEGTPSMYCVDNQGTSKPMTTNLSAGAVACE